VARTDLHRGRPSRRFWWPTAGNLLRSYGAVLRGLPDPGIAIGAPAGTEVYTVDSGTVITCVSAGGSAGSAWGNVLAVAHPGDWVSWYAHLDRMLVGEGDRVRKGGPIGTVGCTGAADRPQLGFRLFHDNRPVDPAEHLP
jgi:murein DD-endopeptidase MepM/ murein hydrolase activator NlpD